MFGFCQDFIRKTSFLFQEDVQICSLYYVNCDIFGMPGLASLISECMPEGRL